MVFTLPGKFVGGFGTWKPMNFLGSKEIYLLVQQKNWGSKQ